jgi:nitroreductase
MIACSKVHNFFGEGNIMTPVLNLLSAHRSIRKFTAKSVDETLLTSLISAAQCTSTSHHIQAYTIIQVTDPDTRQKIADMAGPQPWVAQAPEHKALADYDQKIQAYYERRSPTLKDRTWSRQMADFTAQVIRPHMKAFLEKKGFFRQ